MMKRSRYLLVWGVVLVVYSLAVQAGSVEKIMFHAERNNNVDIYTRNIDGTGEERMTSSSKVDEYPVFCGNDKFVFSSDRDGSTGQYDIFIHNIDGTGTPTNLTPNTPNSSEHEPHCGVTLTTSNMIVFRSDKDGNSEIYRVNKDGTGLTRLSNNGFRDENPQWCGNDIIFVRDDKELAPCPANDPDPSNPGVNYHLYLMDKDGANEQKLTSTPYTEPYQTPECDDNCCQADFDQANFYWPSCKLDETTEEYKVAFSAATAANYAFREIYHAPLPSSSSDCTTTPPSSDCIGFPNTDPNVTQVTSNTEIMDDYPSWSPDGDDIAFMSDRDGNMEIYRIGDAGEPGETAFRVTNESGEDSDPHWSKIKE